MEHLDASTVKELVAGRGDPRAWAQHLEQGCEDCEAVIEQADFGAHEGRVDALLLARMDTSAAPLDEVGWQRVRRALARRPSRALWGLPVALAAGLAAWVLVPRTPARADLEDGVKGTAAPQIELTIAERTPAGELRRVESGATVKEQSVLVLRYHATQPGAAGLWLQRKGAAPRLLGPVELEAGTHELAARGEVLGVSLEGEVGEVSLWLAPADGKVARPVESQAPPASVLLHVTP